MLTKTIRFIAITLAAYIFCFSILYFVKIKNKPLIQYSSKTIRHKGKKHAFKGFNDFNPSKKYDAIIVGSSHAYRGYDPRIFAKQNIEIYNLGTSIQLISDSYAIIKNYVFKENTSLVILDIFEGTFTSDGMEASVSLIQNLPKLESAIDIAIQSKDLRALNMITFRVFDDLFYTPPSKDSVPNYFSNSIYIRNGYSETKDSLYNLKKNKKTIDGNSKERIPLKNNPRFQHHYNSLEKIMKVLAERKIKLVLTGYPYPDKEEKGNYHKTFEKEILKLADKYNVKYLDYFYLKEINSQYHFYDSHHLNQAGVEIYNDTLIKDLKHLAYIPDEK